MAWLAIFFFVVAAGFAFDAWWHTAVGRDDFWIPPHLVILIGAGALTLHTLFLVIREEAPRAHRSAFLLKSSLLFQFAFYLGLALDNSAHALFGQENISTFLVVFAPPHLFMGLSLFMVGFFLSRLFSTLKVESDQEPERVFLVTLVMGSVMALALLQYQPFQPYGLYRILGIFGQLPLLIILGILFSWFFYSPLRYRWMGLSLSIVAVTLEAIRLSGDGVAPTVPFPFMPFRIPSLVHYGSLLLGGFAVDLFRTYAKYAVSARTLVLAGSIYGLVQGIAYYPATQWWVGLRYPEIVIPWSDTLWAITLGTLGGGIGFVLPYGFMYLLKKVNKK